MKRACFFRVPIRLLLGMLPCLPLLSRAADLQISGLTIASIRAVGDYHATNFSKTLEIWFTVPLQYPAGSPCKSTFRVIVNAEHKHLISAVYLALGTGKKVNISVDDTLPIRDGACEVNYLDVLRE